MERIGEKLLGDILKEYVREAGFEEKMQALDICAIWPQAVGSRVAAATRNLYFSDGVLHCQLSSSTLRNILFFNLEGVRNELNRIAGGTPVKKIVLR